MLRQLFGVAGLCNFCNFVRHRHLDIQLAHENDWVELNVYQRIRETHQTDEQQVERSTENENCHVEFVQTSILSYACIDKSAFDQMAEVEIQAEVEEQVDGLLSSSVDIVDGQPRFS